MCFFNKKIEELKFQIDTLQRKLDNSLSQIDELKKLVIVNPNEEIQNNKYPSSNVVYIAYETDGTYEKDVREWINPYDYNLPVFIGSDDEKALSSCIWVQDNIKYISDKSEYGYDEYWAKSYQTLTRKKGDCEDGAILMANIMLKSGVPYWKIRISAGNVWVPDAQSLNTTADIDYISKWFSQKGIDFGTILKVLPQELKKESISAHQQSLKQAIELGIQEKDEKCEHFADMLGELLSIDQEDVKLVEKSIEENLEYTTKIKTDLITIQRIYKYYVILVIQDITGKKEILETLRKDKFLGTKGTSGHAYVTYFDETNLRWVTLDWCYYPNKKAISQRIDYKEDKLYGSIWFSFNQKLSFSQAGTKVSINDYVKKTGKAVKKKRKA